MGCSSDATASSVQPACAEGDDATATNGVILMAQSVPTASWVPCLRTALPLGWSFHHLDARDGTASFWLNSDRDGQQAIEVRLDPLLRHGRGHPDPERPGGHGPVRAGAADHSELRG